jgi:ribosomal protein L7/L12
MSKVKNIIETFLENLETVSVNDIKEFGMTLTEFDNFISDVKGKINNKTSLRTFKVKITEWDEYKGQEVESTVTLAVPTQECLDFWKNGDKIKAIKAYRTAYNSTLAEAKNALEQYFLSTLSV